MGIQRPCAIKEMNYFSGCLLLESLWKSLVVARGRDEGKVGSIALYKEKSLHYYYSSCLCNPVAAEL